MVEVAKATLQRSLLSVTTPVDEQHDATQDPGATPGSSTYKWDWLPTQVGLWPARAMGSQGIHSQLPGVAQYLKWYAPGVLFCHERDHG